MNILNIGHIGECKMDVLHLVKQKNEVDAEGHTQRQHSHVVEIPGKIILRETL